MKYTIDDQNLMWTLEAEPQKYSGKEYIIYSKDYGVYTKKEAEIICEFLRKGNLLNIVYKAKDEN